MSLFWGTQVGLIKDVSEIRHKMLRAVADLRQLAGQQTDLAKAAEMRGIADRLETLANEE